MHQPKRACSLLLVLVILSIFVFTACPVQAEQTPLVGIPVSVNWDHVPEEMVPAQLTVLFVPDGIGLMSANLLFTAESQWRGTVQTIGGTRTMVISVPPLEGLEYRLLGSIEEGYTIEYHPEGAIPDDNAKLADQSVDPAEISHAEVETIRVSKAPQAQAADGLPVVSTSEGESLSREEMEQRMVAAVLEQQGITAPNRTLYIIGIVICGVLIIAAVIARILLGRRNEG